MDVLLDVGIILDEFSKPVITVELGDFAVAVDVVIPSAVRLDYAVMLGCLDIFIGAVVAQRVEIVMKSGSSERTTD